MSVLGRLKSFLAPYWERAKRYPGGEPDFIIIGAQKSGTTALYSYLIQHPQILSPATKEVHFFDRGSVRRKGMSFYRSHFWSDWYKDQVATEAGHPVLCGEATGAYIFYPPVARLVAQSLPGVKLIAILRNPIRRALSHYHHNRRRRPEDEPLSFDEAVRAEDERVAEDEKKLRADPLHEAKTLKKYSYIRRGLYYQQLQRWLEHFDREQLLVLHSRNLREKPDQVLENVFGFLGVDDVKIPNTDPRHVGGYEQPIAPSTRNFLGQRFREDVSRLFAFLQEDWGWFD
ncbi:sulfotransferase domain-containing protein [Salinibacter sp.]|uniref:sulfotransferase domain-containing protein n=1 Tax=Salinibacter sp. TaxID=2065818 RepID=UPI0021E7DE49|nr:sulfotransferase domain-containing protein [Salinibacter sp.]